MRASIRVLTVATMLGTAAGRAEAVEARVSFATEMQPILTKLGCNQSACHGAQYGKGSFKLSLLGFDDAADHREIVGAAFGRRISTAVPAASRADVDNRYVTHFAPTRLGAEALLDAVDFACGTTEKFTGLPKGFRAIDLQDSDYASEFLDTFGRPRRAVPCECERSEAPR